jgi:hypothetical protein
MTARKTTAKATAEADPCGMTPEKQRQQQKRIPKGNDRKKGKSNGRSTNWIGRKGSTVWV